MAFIFAFVLLTLALPVTVESYKRRGNTILSRAGQEVLESKVVTRFASTIKAEFKSLGDFFSGTTTAAVMVGGFVIALWLLVHIISWLFGLFGFFGK